MKIILPFREPEKYPLTQKFGVKFLYNAKICTHKGVDYALPNMTQLIAPFDGVVRRTTPDRTTGYGKSVYITAKEVKNGNYEVLIAHMSSISVEEGCKVKMGNHIGLSGRSGFWRGRNGYHVHFGLAKWGKYFNPLPFMRLGEEDEENLFDYHDASLKSFLGSYTVKKGDSLWGISEKYYGNGGYYIEIYQVNEDILKNPNLIHPGDVLRIPVLKERGI